MWISVTIPIIQKQSEETDLWQQFSVKLSSYWTFLEHPEYFGRRLLTEASVVSRARSEGGSTSHHITSQHHTYRDNITTSQNNLQWQQQQHSAKYCDMEAVWDGTVLDTTPCTYWRLKWTLKNIWLIKTIQSSSLLFPWCHYGWISRSS